MTLWAKSFMDTHVRFESAIHPGDVVVEVGACTGEYTLPIARRVGEDGHVYTFEADPLAYKCLDENIEVYGLSAIVSAENVAVSRDHGNRLTLQHLPDSIASSSLHIGSEGNLQYEVSTVSLDRYFENHEAREQISVLKMTVNGHEPDIIAGATDLLSQLHHVVFQTARYDETIRLLASHGFAVEGEHSPYAGMKVVLMVNERLR